MAHHFPRQSGPVDPSFLVVKKTDFNKNVHLTVSLQNVHVGCQYSKTCLKQPLKKDKTKTFITNGSLMKVKRIAVCSQWSILQYFWPALSDNWSSLVSGR